MTEFSRPRWPAALAALALSCTPAPPPAPDDDLRYACRVEVTPLRVALRAAGGDPSRVLHPTDLRALAELENDRRYKFVLTGRGRLAIAPRPADTEHNEYTHPILSDGASVRSAGGIRVRIGDGAVDSVVLDAESYAYCTPTESLRAMRRTLVAMGVPSERITVEGRPFACVVAPEAPAHYSALMPSIGRRYELLGRALAAHNLDLATYFAHELAEDVEELPNAIKPPEIRADLAPLAQAFDAASLHPLEEALAARDEARARSAYALAAVGCNNCHQAAQRPSLRISGAPGESVPRMELDAPDAGAREDDDAP